MMSENDVIRAVRTIRYSSQRLRNQRRSASVNALAAAAGLTRKCVYEVAQRGTMSPETANKLRSALSLIGGSPDLSLPRLDNKAVPSPGHGIGCSPGPPIGRRIEGGTPSANHGYLSFWMK